MKKPDYSPDLFPHWMTLPIRYRDLDTLNHVNNAIFSTYFEEARIDFIRDVPEFREQLEQRYSFVLARIEIEFASPAEYPAELLAGTGITSLGNTSITCFQAIYHAARKNLVAAAEISGVWFDLDRQRPARLPDIPNADSLKVDRQRMN